MNDNCIFCKIIKGEIPSNIIYEDKDIIILLDRFPASKGHTLIIPKEHIENIYALDDELAQKIFSTATKISKILKENLNCDGLNILQNNGEIAGQTVFHFHMHLIPRFKNDNVKFTWKTLEISDEDLQYLTVSLKK